MSEVRIAILDDNELVVKTLILMLNKMGYKSIYSAYSYEQGIQILTEVKPDLFLLDINLVYGKNGIDFADMINEQYQIPFIFITSNTDIETIDEAILTKPSGYLSKPFKQSDLISAVKIALAQSKKESSDEPSLSIKYNTSNLTIRYIDIHYIKSEHVYLKFFLRNDKSYLIRGSLKDIMLRLNNHFVRVHKSYIINLKHLTHYNSKNVWILENKIPLGRSFIKQLKDQLGTH